MEKLFESMPPNFKIINNLEDYKNEYSTASPFIYKNYEKLFAIFFFIYIFLIVLFLVKLLFNIKKMKRMNTNEMIVNKSNINRCIHKTSPHLDYIIE